MMYCLDEKQCGNPDNTNCLLFISICECDMMPRGNLSLYAEAAAYIRYQDGEGFRFMARLRHKTFLYLHVLDISSRLSS